MKLIQKLDASITEITKQSDIDILQLLDTRIHAFYNNLRNQTFPANMKNPLNT